MAINNNQIVPIQKIDRLSAIGETLALIGTSYTVLASKDVEGTFEVTGTGAAGTFIANQPVKTLDFKTGVTSGTVYFIPAFDYEGITVAGAAATIADGSDTVKPDGVSLYKAALASGEVTVTAVTPMAA